jgi:hypothetical protein
MRTAISALILAASLITVGAHAAGAASVGTNLRAGGVLANITERVQYYGGYCERLRRACAFKEQRGEVGEGNCRRYRAECGGRVSYCEQLRRACIYKDYRGEAGQGNCRRYRYECGR